MFPLSRGCLCSYRQYSSRPTHVNEIVQVMVKDFISINVTVDYMMCIQYLRSIKTREHMNKVLINGGIQNF